MGVLKERGLITAPDYSMTLIREEGLFTKSDVKNISDSLLVLLAPHFTTPTDNFTGQIHKFDTVFIPNHIKIKTRIENGILVAM